MEKGVINLIKHILEKIQADNSHVYTAGTSKVGYASLYFTIKYGFKASISGAPQTLLGDYLAFENHRSYFQYIAESYSEENKQFLNNLLFNVCEEQESFPNIHIVVGQNDAHYKNHVLPFINYLKEKDIDYDVELLESASHM